MRTTYVYNPETGSVVKKRRPKRRFAHSVISDEMEPMLHPCNGKRYTSKKLFRDETRARGCTEVGNETIPDRVDRSLPPGLRGEISRVYDQLSGRR